MKKYVLFPEIFDEQEIFQNKLRNLIQCAAGHRLQKNQAPYSNQKLLAQEIYDRGMKKLIFTFLNFSMGNLRFAFKILLLPEISKVWSEKWS